MAYGQFVSSEPVGDGTYRFGLANGNSWRIGGPQAEDLNRKILAGMPRSDALGPGALAENASPAAGVQAPQLADVSAPSPTAQAGQARDRGVLGGIADTAQSVVSAIPGVGPVGGLLTRGALSLADRATGGGERPAAKAAPGPVPGPATAPVGAPATPAAQGAPGPTVPASAAAEQQPQQQQGDIPLNYTMEAIGPNGQKIHGPAVKRPDGSIGVYVPPSRGSPGGFTKLGQATIEAHQQAEQVAQSAEEIAAQAKAAGVQAEVENLAAQEGQAEEQKWQAQVAVNDKEEELKAAQERVNGLHARYAAAQEEAESGKVDENRYMKGSKGTLAAIGMALGAFGAVLGKSPNFAQQYVENQIDRDIRSQESELKMKGKKADNALGDLTRELGSLENGKLALKELLLARTAANEQAAAMTSKSEQRRQYGIETAALLEASKARTAEARGMAFQEHVMKDPYYQKGRAGSTGGFLQPTLQGVQNVKDLQTDKSDTNPLDARAIQVERSEKIGAAAQAIVAADVVKKQLGALGVRDSGTDDPTRGLIDSTTRAASRYLGTGELSQDVTKLNDATFQLARGAQASLGKSDNDALLAEQQVTSGGTGADRERAANAVAKKAIDTIRTELSTASPAQQKAILDSLPLDARRLVLGEKKK